VYKISCKNCDAIYVGRTKRKLNTRISEHRNQINRKSTNTSDYRTQIASQSWFRLVKCENPW